ncbi:PE family protein [Mycobacterium montefiorense]|uniref:PE family protein PE32 n=1 Tax=Mycobacterium montefiorense TaxID=154654 RepID=A0AA37UVR4_9MYCO|nr:PE family protein [Mycobacterium montefiorense]GBG36068.1 PE family protein PE32 [Mycobacterium montefiorense]GKU34068.1 PE family protein PE32 [Mycobacterium montefiorense]GKU41466.1 PE family protein PE32 [Mycobacterium montefiorense]GKU47564.1 PE family protein PE32 [Mycobacterium montefiorense]GKU52363.1 PE family protein PE32 [Mycobacterium montefiorense]
MSFLRAQPEVLHAVAGELHSVNAAVREGSSAAATPTTGVVPAAADVVSILTAAQFASHAQLFQQISAEAAAVREQLVATLVVSAGSYADTELANAAAAG